MIKILAGALGVEPSSGVLETLILPMYYAPINNLKLTKKNYIINNINCIYKMQKKN